MRALKSESRN